MKKCFLLMIAAVAACQPDTRSLERKVDQIAQDQKKIMDMLESGRGRPGAAVAQKRAPRPAPDRSKTYAVPIENDPFEGPADAKVTVVKAYDYACPYCERVRGTMADLRKKYGNDIRIVSKQLVVHPRNAMAGALAFCAASRQGKAKEMDAAVWDKGFKQRQMDLSDVPPAEGGGKPAKCWDTPQGCKNVVSYAQALQLDINKFKQDMKACVPIVEKDMADLRKFSVASTPAFFINGRYISGAVPIENFSRIIDEELKKANQRIQQGTPPAQYYQQWVIAKGLKSLKG